MPYSNKEKERDYRKKWKEKNPDYFKDWRKRHPRKSVYNGEYYRNYYKNNKHWLYKYKSDRKRPLLSLEEKKFRHSVRLKLYYRVRTGRIIRPSICEGCTLTSKLEAHHEDYNKPFDVKWLCKTCHGKTYNQKTAVSNGDNLN